MRNDTKTKNYVLNSIELKFRLNLEVLFIALTRRLDYTKNFWILIFTWITFSFANTLSYTFYPNYVVALGGSEAIIGFIFAVMNISFILSQIPGGYLADFIGRKRLVVSMTWLIAVIDFSIALSPSWHVLLAIAVLDGLSRMYVSALRALFYDSIPQDKRASGIMLSNVVPSLIAIPGPLIGGIIADSLKSKIAGYRVLFIIAGVLALIAAWMRMYLSETYIRKTKVKIKDLVSMIFRSYFELPSRIRTIPRNALMLILLIGMPIAFAGGVYRPYLVRVATGRAGLSDTEWGLLMTIALLSSSIASLILMRTLDKIPHRLLLSIGIGIQALGLYLFTSKQFIVMGIALVILYIGINLAISGYGALLTSFTPIDIRGTVISIDNVLSVITAILGNIVASILYPQLYERSFYTPIIVMIVTGMMVLLHEIKLLFSSKLSTHS